MKRALILTIIASLLLTSCQSLGVGGREPAPTITPRIISASSSTATPIAGTPEATQALETEEEDPLSDYIPCGEVAELNDLGLNLGDYVVVYEAQAEMSDFMWLSPEGYVYLLTADGILLMVDLFGQVCSEVELVVGMENGPYMVDEGYYFFTDPQAGVQKFDPNGVLLWEFHPQVEGKSVSWPTFAPDGRMFYTIQDGDQVLIQAVSPEGEGLWQVVSDVLSLRYPRVTPDGEYILLGEQIYFAEDGTRLNYELPFEVDSFAFGGGGQTYLRTPTRVYPVTITPGGIIVAEEGVSMEDPVIYSIVTQDGTVISFGLPKGDTLSNVYIFSWFKDNGEAIGVSRTSRLGPYDGWPGIYDVDQDKVIYICGSYSYDTREGERPYCRAMAPNTEEPLWTYRYSGQPTFLTGGMLMGYTFYISTENGQVIAIRAKE
jgi:hypothetical protein